MSKSEEGAKPMNAIQFIKEQGVEKAREVVSGAPDGATHLSDDACHYVNADFKPLPAHIKEQLPKLVVINDLKRLVESVDLVNCNGGWNGTKNTITLFQSSLDLGLYHGVDGVDAEVEIPRLKQAIADYEAIYSDNSMGDDSHIENHISPLYKVGVK